MPKTIYLDHASTTYIDPKVLEAMEPYFIKEYGNPSSFHKIGQNAKRALDDARDSVAKHLNCSSTEIIFTGGGTESINLAIQGIARAYKNFGHHIVTSKIEHKAVLNTCKALEKEGFETTYVGVDKYGMVDPKEVKKAVRKDTILVTIMYANNEIGTIQPISEITKEVTGPLFHTDACQTPGMLPLDTKKLGVDLMTINGSKMYGPKGVGVLYKKSGVKIEPLIYGGGQEWHLRSGTENVPGIIGLAKALELAEKNRVKESARLKKLSQKLTEGIFAKIPKVVLNGHIENRLPNNVNISFLDVEGESIMLYLDKYGICVSTGSACTSDSFEPSHVLTSTGLIHGAAHGSIRFSLGHSNTEKDIDYLLEVLPEIIEKLRQISPIKLDPNKIRR